MTEEAFGLWMLVGKSNRSRISRQAPSDVPLEIMGTKAKFDRPTVVVGTTSRFTALSELNKVEMSLEAGELPRGRWSPVGSRLVEGQVSFEQEGGSFQQEARARRGKKGKGSADSGNLKEGDGPRRIMDQERVLDRGVVDHNTKLGLGSIGLNEERKRNKGRNIGGNKKGVEKAGGPKLKNLGCREHVVVGGNINQVGASSSLQSHEEEGEQINGMFLLEGPRRELVIDPDTFIKEKFENSREHHREFSHMHLIATDLDDDIGDDFNMGMQSQEIPEGMR